MRILEVYPMEAVLCAVGPVRSFRISDSYDIMSEVNFAIDYVAPKALR